MSQDLEPFAAEVAAAMRAAGRTGYYFAVTNAGGTLRVALTPPAGAAWRFELRAPARPGLAAAVLGAVFGSSPPSPPPATLPA